MKRLVSKIRILGKKKHIASPGQPHGCEYRALSYVALGQKRTDRSLFLHNQVRTRMGEPSSDAERSRGMETLSLQG